VSDRPYDVRRSIPRFVALGAANTIGTFLMFVGLQHVLTVGLAYTSAFATGLAFSTAVTARVVFGTRTTRGRQARYACCYLVIYGVGFLVSHSLHGHASPWLVSGGTVAVTAPLGYLAGRTVLVPRAQETRRSP